jgi:hypothetical protein
MRKKWGKEAKKKGAQPNSSRAHAEARGRPLVASRPGASDCWPTSNPRLRGGR